MTSLYSGPHLDAANSAPARPSAGSGVVDFRLDNGLTVVVIPDRRAPVVTHMVWYRNGSADDPPGKSGALSKRRRATGGGRECVLYVEVMSKRAFLLDVQCLLQPVEYR